MCLASSDHAWWYGWCSSEDEWCVKWCLLAGLCWIYIGGWMV